MPTAYTARWYRNQRDASAESAAAVVPFVVELVGPRTVVDVGCGIGTWLAAFVANGVTDVRGLDGDYVDRDALRIPAERFQPADLGTAVPDVGRFDLAVSLEVAEHLPPARAASFVGDLCRLAPVVLFSGAAPRQGGNGHVNEQWLDYWAERFAACGYVMVDAIRPAFWDHDGVAYWYKQNAALFVSPERAAEEAFSRFPRAAMPLRVAHPDMTVAIDERWKRPKYLATRLLLRRRRQRAG